MKMINAEEAKRQSEVWAGKWLFLDKLQYRYDQLKIKNKIKKAIKLGNSSISFFTDIDDTEKIVEALKLWLEMYGYEIKDLNFGFRISWEGKHYK